MPKQTTIESAFKICKDHPRDPLDAARGRVDLYSSHNIKRASDGCKEYYTFSYTKVQELCSDRNFNGYKKQELHGVIDTAWQMRSCEILKAKVEADLKNLSTNKPESHTKTVTKNIKCVQEAKRVAKELNLLICQLKHRSKEMGGMAVKAEILKNEEKLLDAMSKVKLALDALRKSFKNAKKTKPQSAQPVDAEEMEIANEDERKEGIKYFDEQEIDLDHLKVEDLAKKAKQSDDDWENFK